MVILHHRTKAKSLLLLVESISFCAFESSWLSFFLSLSVGILIGAVASTIEDQ